MTTDRYVDWDAAYILGALSSEDRISYERHLADCAVCRKQVGELAGLPGLLATLEPAEVLALDLPMSGLPARDPARVDVTGRAQGAPQHFVPATSRRPVRRRRWLAAAASLLALGGAGAGGYALAAAQRPPAQVIAGPTRLAFSPVAASSMTAVVDLAPVGKRTTITVECQYSGYATDPSNSASYSVWAVSRDGQAQLVTTWQAHPDEVMRPSGSIDLPVSQLAAVEIRRADTGQTIMRARVA